VQTFLPFYTSTISTRPPSLTLTHRRLRSPFSHYCQPFEPNPSTSSSSSSSSSSSRTIQSTQVSANRARDEPSADSTKQPSRLAAEGATQRQRVAGLVSARAAHKQVETISAERNVTESLASTHHTTLFLHPPPSHRQHHLPPTASPPWLLPHARRT